MEVGVGGSKVGGGGGGGYHCHQLQCSVIISHSETFGDTLHSVF